MLDPLDFLARLAALVPPPRFHMLRYHGVLASNSDVRSEVVPKKPTAQVAQLPLFCAGEPGHLEPPPEPSRHPSVARAACSSPPTSTASCDGPSTTFFDPRPLRRRPRLSGARHARDSRFVQVAEPRAP